MNKFERKLYALVEKIEPLKLYSNSAAIFKKIKLDCHIVVRWRTLTHVCTEVIFNGSLCIYSGNDFSGVLSIKDDILTYKISGNHSEDFEIIAVNYINLDKLNIVKACIPTLKSIVALNEKIEVLKSKE